MCVVDQLPCGSVLTPAISCTKFKIHSAHADSPMAERVLPLQFLGRTSLNLLHRSRNSGKELARLNQLLCRLVRTPAISSSSLFPTKHAAAYLLEFTIIFKRSPEVCMFPKVFHTIVYAKIWGDRQSELWGIEK